MKAEKLWFGLVGVGLFLTALSAWAKPRNGLASKKGLTEKDVDQNELRMGIEVEMEHTSDPEKAKVIALDHLAEDPKYYTKLKAYGL